MQDHRPSRTLEALPERVRELQETLEQMEHQQARLRRQRRRDLLAVAVGVSVLMHLGLMYYLATHYRLRPGGGGPRPVTYEFAILPEEQLTDEMEQAELADLLPELAGPSDGVVEAEAAAALDPVIPAADLEINGAGALPTLGGAGDGTVADGGLTGGAAATTFFGVSSRGARFAYVVDRSGSMRAGEVRSKMEVALRELARSVTALPDYASFYVLLFSSEVLRPPMQEGWMRAKKSTVNGFIRWLNEGVDAGGGTEPMSAFRELFALDRRPDVIFFLTDGEIPKDTADLIATLNRQRGPVTINTISFGNASSQALMRRIATESGGAWRYVAEEGF